MNFKVIDEIYDLLGAETFLVPCEGKVPKVKYTDESLVNTFSHVYKKLLLESTIAVYLGKKSNSLVVIDLDDERSAQEFRDAQKIETLVTKGSRGCSLWFRVIDRYPSSTQTEQFELRADGRLSVIRGIHPSGCEYKFLNKTEPARVRFKDIAFPESWDLPWIISDEERITNKYGSLFIVSDKGSVSIRHLSCAELFALDHDILFCVDTDEFYVYSSESGLWERSPQHCLALNTIRWLEKRALAYAKSANLDESETRKFLTALTRSLKSSLLAQIIDFFKIRFSLQNAFASKTSAIHAQNMMISVDANNEITFSEFDKSYFSRNQIAVAYKSGCKATKFISLINEAIPDKDDQDLLQRYFGLALTGSNSAQVIMILSGLGGVGKGTIVDVLSSLIGRENVAMLRTHLLEERFEMSRFIAKTLLYGPDVPPDFLNHSGAAMIKSLTGGDHLDCEIKNGRHLLKLKGDYNVIITSNGRLTVKLQGDAQAWSRRLRIIYFDNPRETDDQIVNYADQLIAEEGAGILDWALQGVRKLNYDLARGSGLRQSSAQAQRVAGIIAESDSVRLFVSTKVQRSGFQSDTVSSAALFEAYLRFCEEEDITPKPKRKFFFDLEPMMQEYHKSEKTRTSDGMEYRFIVIDYV